MQQSTPYLYDRLALDLVATARIKTGTRLITSCLLSLIKRRLNKIPLLVVIFAAQACSLPVSRNSNEAYRREILTRFNGVIKERCIKNIDLRKTKLEKIGRALNGNSFGPSDNMQVRTTLSFIQRNDNSIYLINTMFDNSIQNQIDNKNLNGTGLIVSKNGQVFEKFSATGWLLPQKTFYCLAKLPYDAAPIFLIDQVIVDMENNNER